MKKIIISILILSVFLIFPKEVLAQGGVSVSPSSLSIEAGSSKTFTITAANTVGDGTISSSNTSVATVSESSWETGAVGEGQTVTKTITVTGVSAGTATITITVDGSTFDEEEVSGTRSVQVTVTAKTGPTPVPTPGPTPVKPDKKEEKKDEQKEEKKDDKKEEKKSTNNKVKEVSIVGYDIIKIDDSNYRVTVDNNVETIEIKATPEDKKAKVIGDGEKQLEIGENKIELTIEAEDGSKNKITITVIRQSEEEIIEPEPEPEPVVEENHSNYLPIIMIVLNIILAIAVVILLIKNRKMKRQNN